MPNPNPGPVTYNIAVAAQTQRGNPVANAILEVLDGQFPGNTFTTNTSGMVTLTGAQGNMNVEMRSQGCDSKRLGVGPPATSGQTQSLAFTTKSSGGSGWKRMGTGNQALDMPRCVDRVRIQGSYGGFCQNFAVEVGGDLLVNTILGTCGVASGTSFNGTFSTVGGEVDITISTGVSWMITEIRP